MEEKIAILGAGAIGSSVGADLAKAGHNVVLHYLKGRYSDADFLSGIVVKIGQEANIPMPASVAVTRINQQIRLGVLKPDRSNLALAEQVLR